MKKIGVLGLGYVGLPLAVAFGKYRKVIGYDINSERIKELSNGIDTTKECSSKELNAAALLSFSNELDDLENCEIYIVTVPTPINKAKQPDLDPLIFATENLAKILSHGNIVIYESTVFPGATEEVCVPILEKVSRLKFNKDFFCGYSPERINPGDKAHRLANIVKVTSGSNALIADEVDQLYCEIITAGTWKAESIKVAEASKVIENTQRDLNIALINEFSIIFGKLNIDTTEVLAASATKWNFLDFKPGLVGGHCIGVDPYYLTYKSQMVGHNPDLILAGRKLNDEMPAVVAKKLLRKLLKSQLKFIEQKILIIGITFKENCKDIRNTKILDLINELSDYGLAVDVYDPIASKKEVFDTFGIKLLEALPPAKYAAIVLAVPHEEVVNLGLETIRSSGLPGHVFFDLKSNYAKTESDMRL
jgi:UDP-N-acetyl-D-glucosamine/UDP-N-acetyl-D-galactosamine dehydrogenase